MLDASTFKNQDLINLAKENFINLKIDAESEYGNKLFTQFNGAGYPLIIFLDKDGVELDRFYGYIPAYEFILKMNNVIEGKNTFSDYLDQYDLGNHSAELLKPLADKYREKGNNKKAIELYSELIKSSNISKESFISSKYYIASLSLKDNGSTLMQDYLNQFENSAKFENGVYDLINYYKSNQMEADELETYASYLPRLNQSYNFLNSYAWRMSELSKNLDDALNKINIALILIDKDNQGYANILDTKAEVLWKTGKMEEAIFIIEKALKIDPNSEYFKSQKEKFLKNN